MQVCLSSAVRMMGVMLMVVSRFQRFLRRNGFCALWMRDKKDAPCGASSLLVLVGIAAAMLAHILPPTKAKAFVPDNVYCFRVLACDHVNLH